MSGSPISPAERSAPLPRRDVALAPLTTFGVAARAHRLWEIDSPEAIDPVLSAVAGPRRPFILGGGSNLLLARDLDEPVLAMRLRGRQLLADDGERVDIEVAAGEGWHDTVRWTLAQGWFGLENLSLIPGLVGAAPWQNIGAYGVEVGERIGAVDAVHLGSRERRRFSAHDCEFGYRSSFFKSAAGRDWLITAVQFRLSRVADIRINYGGLAEELTSHDPRAIGAAVERIRQRKLPDPARIGNAGSFFKNPLVDRHCAERLRREQPGLPAYPVADDGGAVKLSAGWLIEAAGWKGHRDGDAGVSAEHALVLVNHGRASGAELLALARRIQASVQQRFGVRLEPEPVIIE